MGSKGRSYRAVAIAVALTPALAGAAAAAAEIDVLDYAVEIEPDLAAGRLDGEVTITFTAAGAGALELDAHGLDVEEVTAGGEPLDWRAADGRLRVALPGAARREARTVRIRYSARPERGLHLAAGRAYTAFHTDHWLPCRMDPADKATATLAVTLPPELEVVGPGRRVAREEGADGGTRHVFRLDRPHSAYLLGFAAGRLTRTSRRVGDVELELAGEGFRADEIERLFADVEEMMGFLAARAGVPFPAAAYRQVLLDGAPPQEMATMAVLPARYGRALLADPREDYLIVHELAHEWWGNALTARNWSHFWLQEGTATYLVAAWKEHHWGREEYDRERVLARLRYARSREAEPTRRLVPPAAVGAEDAGGAVPYSLGMLVLHLLRVELGDAAFGAGLAAFTRDGIAAGLADTADLQAAFERTSGRDLDSFFATWVHGVPPRLSARHRVEHGEAGGTAVVAIESLGGGPVTLRVAVETADERSARRVDVPAGAAAEVRFAVSGPVLSVRVDDGGHLPIGIDHPRPLAMLRRQVTGEPDLIGRVEALLGLVAACSPPAAGCADLAAFLAEQAAAHPSRLVRELAARELAGLDGDG